MCDDVQRPCCSTGCFPSNAKCWADPVSGCKKGFEATYSCSAEWGILFNLAFFSVVTVYAVGGKCAVLTFLMTITLS